MRSLISILISICLVGRTVPAVAFIPTNSTFEVSMEDIRVVGEFPESRFLKGLFELEARTISKIEMQNELELLLVDYQNDSLNYNNDESSRRWALALHAMDFIGSRQFTKEQNQVAVERFVNRFEASKSEALLELEQFVSKFKPGQVPQENLKAKIEAINQKQLAFIMSHAKATGSAFDGADLAMTIGGVAIGVALIVATFDSMPASKALLSIGGAAAGILVVGLIMKHVLKCALGQCGS
ncbi:MAG: hypothetical protein IT289_05570 [Oligoflexia bacterium]|nr:hypothetical protein [Oligoflexia bacterium]